MHTPSLSYKLNSPVSTNVLLNSSPEVKLLGEERMLCIPHAEYPPPHHYRLPQGPVQNLPPPGTVSYLIPAYICL